eukprot:767186-Hanusia_phi.AAC.5
MVVGGQSSSLAIKGIDKAANAIMEGKKAVYFEQNRRGKWIVVAVPAGMTKQQLMRWKRSVLARVDGKVRQED